MKTKKTIKIKAAGEFNSTEFIREICAASIEATLMILIDDKTHVYLEMRNGREDILNAMEIFLSDCEIEETDLPIINLENCIAILVRGVPVKEASMERFVSKILETGNPALLLLLVSPLKGMSIFLKTTFAIILPANEEINETLAMISMLVHSVFGITEMQVQKGWRAKHTIRKLLQGKHIHPIVLSPEQAACYFQIPQTYGVESIRKMNFPQPSSLPHGIEIGRLAEHRIGDCLVRLGPTKLFEHVAVWGASGTGKTTFLKNFLIRLSTTDTKFCIIDWHNEYRDIVSLCYGKLGEDILIFNPLITPFSINPLEIPETDNRDIIMWERIENFISMLRQLFVIGEVQESRVRNVLQDLYSQTNTPTIGDLIKQLKQKKADPLVFKLEKFTKGFYGRLLNQRKSTIPFNEIRKKNVIFELGEIPTEVRTFFVSTFLIMWWDYLKLSESIPHVLVLDDFQRYSELGVVRKMLSEARKFKQGLICSHQGPYQLSDMMRSEIVRNTATKIIFRQEQTWDKYIVRDALGGLEKHQLENLSYLETGQCIVKLPSVKVPIRVDTFAPPAGRRIEDWEVAKAMEKYARVIKREEPRHEEPIEKIFLENIYKDPYIPLTKLANALPPRQGHNQHK